MGFPTNTTQAPVTGQPPPPHDPNPVSRAEFEQLMARLTRIEERSIRTETRVMRLLEHHGLDARGHALTS